MANPEAPGLIRCGTPSFSFARSAAVTCVTTPIGAVPIAKSIRSADIAKASTAARAHCEADHSWIDASCAS